jgi:hypothetical protein
VRLQPLTHKQRRLAGRCNLSLEERQAGELHFVLPVSILLSLRNTTNGPADLSLHCIETAIANSMVNPVAF